MADEETQKYEVRVVVSSLGNERRNISFGEMDDDQLQKLIQTVSVAFHSIRTSHALMLTGSDGVVIFANLDNVAFVEVQIV
jgi:hypothetical protein